LIPEFLGLSESQIRRHLTLEEEKEMVTSTAVDSDKEFTETKYLLYGLDVEEQQYVSSAVFQVRETNPTAGASYGLSLHR
jgi:hypothetical protein